MSIIERAIQLRGAAPPTPPRHPVGSATPAVRGGAPEKTRSRDVPNVAYSRLIELGMLPDPERDAELIRHLQYLKRPILQNAAGVLVEGIANVVMVTSALPESGKTYLSAGLAYSITKERDRSVVVIDLDNIRGSLTRGLDLSGTPGFFDVVDNHELTLDDVMRPTEIPGLAVIPCGRQFSDSAELLSCARAQDLLRTLSEEDASRVIILDTPPLLSTPDAHAVVELAHQILVVVEAGVTKLSSLNQILPALKGNKPVGLVLNKSPANWLSEYGGDYYAGSYEPV